MRDSEELNRSEDAVMDAGSSRDGRRLREALVEVDPGRVGLGFSVIKPDRERDALILSECLGLASM